MAYKKYIKKGGKLYGPYIDHSRRVDGKVVSEYHGVKKKSNYKYFLLVLFGIFLLIALAYVLIFSKGKISGQAVFDLEANYQKGQPLEGSLTLSLKEGELIPASSKIIFKTPEQEYEYNLEELVLDELTEGEFYLETKNISGNGSGYGEKGTKKVYPDIYFTLYAYSHKVLEEDSEEVSVEFGTEIQGEVSAGYSFVYDLEEGQTAEILSRSVETDSGKLPDETVELVIEGNKAIVTTNYSEDEQGFGEEYLGNSEKIIIIDLNNLDLIAEQGELKVSLVYDQEEIISLETLLEEGEITANESFEEIISNETEIEPNITKTNQIPIQTLNITKVPDILTSEEREILSSKFGNASVERTAELFNGRIIVRYELGDYWIEYSYDSDTSNLDSLMEIDRIRWLKDLARELSHEESVSEKLTNFSNNYSI